MRRLGGDEPRPSAVRGDAAPAAVVVHRHGGVDDPIRRQGHLAAAPRKAGTDPARRRRRSADLAPPPPVWARRPGVRGGRPRRPVGARARKATRAGGAHRPRPPAARGRGRRGAGPQVLGDQVLAGGVGRQFRRARQRHHLVEQPRVAQAEVAAELLRFEAAGLRQVGDVGVGRALAGPAAGAAEMLLEGAVVLGEPRLVALHEGVVAVLLLAGDADHHQFRLERLDLEHALLGLVRRSAAPRGRPATRAAPAPRTGTRPFRLGAGEGVVGRMRLKCGEHVHDTSDLSGSGAAGAQPRRT